MDRDGFVWLLLGALARKFILEKRQREMKPFCAVPSATYRMCPFRL